MVLGCARHAQFKIKCLLGTEKLMANNHDTLIREVKEELEREKLEQLWSKYSGVVIAAVVLFLGSVIGFQYWQNAHRAAIEGAGAKYEAALEFVATETPSVEDAAKAQALFGELVADGPTGYHALSQLQIAGLQVKAGKKDDALKVYEALAKNSEVDTILRDFAALQAASLRVGDADFAEVENRLNALSGDTNPWRFGALQLLGATAFQEGKYDKARAAFEKLMANPKVPGGIRDRASMYMARIIRVDMEKERADSAGGAASNGAAAGSEQSTGTVIPAPSGAAEGGATPPTPSAEAPGTPAPSTPTP